MARREFDLVFMDCQMPLLDGWEATRRIRENELKNGASHQPIVAVTAHAGEHALHTSLKAGMDELVTKRISIADLQHMLDKWSVQGTSSIK